MRPARNPNRCIHPEDEWCDHCFLPLWERQMVDSLIDIGRALAYDPKDVTRALEAVIAAEPDWGDWDPAPRPCLNGRHPHNLRQGQSCDRERPPAPLIHRAVGNVVLAAAVALGVAVYSAASAVDWVRTDGRLHVALARQRVHDAWCRSAG